MQDCKLVNSHILCKYIIAAGVEFSGEHPDYLTREMPDGQHVLLKPCRFSEKYCSVIDPKFKSELKPKPDNGRETEPDTIPKLKM